MSPSQTKELIAECDNRIASLEQAIRDCRSRISYIRKVTKDKVTPDIEAENLTKDFNQDIFDIEALIIRYTEVRKQLVEHESQ